MCSSAARKQRLARGGALAKACSWPTISQRSQPDRNMSAAHCCLVLVLLYGIVPQIVAIRHVMPPAITCRLAEAWDRQQTKQHHKHSDATQGDQLCHGSDAAPWSGLEPACAGWLHAGLCNCLQHAARDIANSVSGDGDSSSLSVCTETIKAVATRVATLRKRIALNRSRDVKSCRSSDICKRCRTYRDPP